MIVHVYEVVRLFVVDVDSTDTKTAIADAIKRAESGEITAQGVDGRMIAVIPNSNASTPDPQVIVRKLLRKTPEELTRLSAALGLRAHMSVLSGANRANWIADLLRNSAKAGKLSELSALL